MQNTYNFYNLETSFKQYLVAGITKPVSIKNYLSDIRHFFGWLSLYIGSHDLKILDDKFPLRAFITIETISEYKNYLLENKIPHKTINRRLSTIRKLCTFCIEQNILDINPAKHLTNILSLPEAQTEGLVQKYQEYLKSQGRDQTVITSSLNTIQELLQTI